MEPGAKGRRLRDTTSDQNKAKICVNNTKNIVKPTFNKVQVVYYLSRNGQLEHPHYMEVTHLVHQQLRLKDVMDRLTVLRGKGMPSLYSWSCKRSYKNGYVWNDLSENDVISTSEGGTDYVLKGSELIEGCTEKIQQHLQITNRSQILVPEPTHLKRSTIPTERHPHPGNDSDKSIIQYEYENNDEENMADIDNDDMFKRTNYTSSMTPQHSRCSRGVSTDELTREETTHKNHKITVLTLDNNSSPPSTTSSTASDKATNEGNNNTSKRFELDDDLPVVRNSVLLQLISCGSTSFRAKAVPLIRETPPPGTTARKSGATDLRKAATCRAAIDSKVGLEEEAMILCMSENPRFGNLQAEEKEYFSGSIVEAMEEEREKGEIPVRLTRSSSYNQERKTKAELCGAEVDHEVDLPKREKVVVRGKCIPRMMSYYSSSSKYPKK